MGACGRGAPDWTSKNRVQATVENAQRFPSGCGRAPPAKYFEGASMPAAGAAASTGRFEARPPRRWERGRGGEGMKKRLTRMPQDERIRPGPYLGYPPLGGLASPLAHAGVVADVGQGVDSPQLSIEPARKDEGIEAISEGSQGGKP